MWHMQVRLLVWVLVLTSAAALLPISSQSQEIRPVTIRFRVVVGNEPFACGASYSNIGITRSTITPSDFRFYVHNIRLLDGMNNAVPVQLDQDEMWQLEHLALLDFENGAGPCLNGTPELRDIVTGHVPAGHYRGIQFTVGVPFERNHRDPLTQPSPLNISSMFWVWNVGYKFLRLDMRTTGLPRGAAVHLGSTNCTPNDTALTVPTRCANPNRPEITLLDFDPDSHLIVADLKALLDGVNVDVNQSGAALCESSPNDTDCARIFHNLGLPFRGVASSGQTLFRVEPVPRS
ncbi:MAG: metallo-mystery pair system four-Cys motif protein [Acidobacteriota bacterium]|nr:metallo-mystery pair system four-Cys motif protein [Blastocatellia bacterium]MDW8241247.1 metallo-mystery pair system four-Cys motif protein [Acidobacteriota bacterium]